jgi:hypothetical protein
VIFGVPEQQPGGGVVALRAQARPAVIVRSTRSSPAVCHLRLVKSDFMVAP